MWADTRTMCPQTEIRNSTRWFCHPSSCESAPPTWDRKAALPIPPKKIFVPESQDYLSVRSPETVKRESVRTPKGSALSLPMSTRDRDVPANSARWLSALAAPSFFPAKQVCSHRWNALSRGGTLAHRCKLYAQMIDNRTRQNSAESLLKLWNRQEGL